MWYQPARPRPTTNQGHKPIDVEQGRVTITHQMLPDSKDRPRPKGRLASYISTHLANTSSDRPEFPTIQSQEISFPNEKDKVYDPDIDLMCNSIKKRMLTHPGKDLPAQYNSFLVHILEAHNELSTENQMLHSQLTASQKTRQAGEEKYRLSYAAWDQERKGYESRLAKAVSKPSGERLTRRISQGDGPLAIEDVDESCRDELKSRYSDFTVGDGESPLWSKHSGNGGWRRRWPASPSKSMANLSQRILSSKASVDSLPPQPSSNRGQAPSTTCPDKQPSVNPRWMTTSRRRKGTVETSDSDLSSTEGDLLPDEEEGRSSHSELDTHALHNRNIAVHLTQWLAERAGLKPNATSPEITAILSGTDTTESREPSRLATQNTDKSWSVHSLSSQNVVAGIGCPTNRRPPSSDQGAVVNPSAGHQLSHHRVFSFIPGDDVKTLMPARSTPDFSKVLREEVTSSFPSSKRESRGRSDGMVKPPPEKPLSDVKLDSLDNAPIERSMKSDKEETATTPQRENSACSVLTAIKNHSPGGSDTFPCSSITSDGNARKSKRRPRIPKESIAVAAARAAGGTISAPINWMPEV